MVGGGGCGGEVVPEWQMEVVGGVGAVRGEIPAAKRGCDGGGVWVWRALGVARGEIPLFGPGAGSAASAGMTELGARVWWEKGWG